MLAREKIPSKYQLLLTHRLIALTLDFIHKEHDSLKSKENVYNKKENGMGMAHAHVISMMTDMTDMTHMTALKRILSERIILFAGRLVCGVATTLL